MQNQREVGQQGAIWGKSGSTSPSIRKTPNSEFLPILRIFKDVETDPKNLRILKNI
jgi:hypothetical protein